MEYLFLILTCLALLITSCQGEKLNAFTSDESNAPLKCHFVEKSPDQYDDVYTSYYGERGVGACSFINDSFKCIKDTTPQFYDSLKDYFIFSSHKDSVTGGLLCL